MGINPIVERYCFEMERIYGIVFPKGDQHHLLMILSNWKCIPTQKSEFCQQIQKQNKYAGYHAIVLRRFFPKKGKQKSNYSSSP